MGVISAIAIIGAVVAAVGTVTSGIAAKRTAKFNSQVAEQQALRARQVAEVNETDFRRRTSRQLAAARAAVIASGGDPGSGSSLLSFTDFAEEAELDALTIRNQGAVQASRLDQQASLFQQAGKDAQTAGFIRGGATLLTGFSNFSKAGGFGSGSDDKAPISVQA